MGIAAVACGTMSLQADPIITGSVTFAGSASASESGGVTTFTPADPWWNIGGTQSYAGTFGAATTFNAISYTGTGGTAALTAPVDPLWSFTVSGVVYSFSLTALTSASVGQNFVDMTGMGVANITGYQTTDATWSLAGAGSDETFVINFSTTSSSGVGAGSGNGETVPDGGTTVMMLGMAVGACWLFARKFQVA